MAGFRVFGGAASSGGQVHIKVAVNKPHHTNAEVYDASGELLASSQPPRPLPPPLRTRAVAERLPFWDPTMMAAWHATVRGNGSRATSAITISFDGNPLTDDTLTDVVIDFDELLPGMPSATVTANELKLLSNNA
jgi:hypothetical protein